MDLLVQSRDSSMSVSSRVIFSLNPSHKSLYGKGKNKTAT